MTLLKTELVRILRQKQEKERAEKSLLSSTLREQPLLAIDHCFPIKGKGTVLTGTVLEGTVR